MPGRTRWFRRALFTVVLGLVVAANAGAPAGAVLAPPPVEPQPRAWILVDADTGDVLDASNEHEPMLVASTVKLLTAITALEHLPTDSVLTVSQRAAERPPFKMNMQAGEEWLLPHVLSSMLIVSANDAAYVLAEASGGSVEAFTEQMRATGERLGLSDSTFADPAGLDDETSTNGGSLISAYDLAIIGRNALAIPAIAERASMEREVFDDLSGTTRTLPTRNDVFLALYEGATGLKTGGTEAAGSHLVASATRDGRNLVAVVLGVPDTAAWAGLLLDRGFSGDASASGERLPDVQVRTADATRAAVDALPRLLGRPPLELDGSTVAGETSVAGAPAPTITTRRAEPPASVAASDGGIGLPVYMAIAGFIVLVALVVLRRRAVKRRRRRRLARQQALSEARRRGMIDVIDPTERTGGSVNVTSDRGRSL